MLRRLSDPDDWPGTDVVIFDGNCQFCKSQIERLAKFPGAGCLSFISLHDSRVQVRYPDLPHEMLMKEIFIVDTKGQRYGGADAIKYLSRRLRALWPVMPILHLPLSAKLWRWCYNQIARRRYRWNRNGCEGGACEVHFGGRRKP